MEYATDFEIEKPFAGCQVAGRFPITTIASLRVEREQLEEEIRQLRAAVQIYAEIARRTAERATATRSMPQAA